MLGFVWFKTTRLAYVLKAALERCLESFKYKQKTKIFSEAAYSNEFIVLGTLNSEIFKINELGGLYTVVGMPFSVAW